MANQDNPNIIQIEEMVNFCNKYKHVFIYDCKIKGVISFS